MKRWLRPALLYGVPLVIFAAAATVWITGVATWTPTMPT